MKKTYYLLAFVAMAFTACQKQPVVPTLVTPVPASTITTTLAAADYALLPSTNYAAKSLSFNNTTDATVGIPVILSAKYPLASNGSTAAVTYAQAPASFTVADSVIADDSYTLTNADYLLLPGNKYTDFSVAQLLQWLPYKFPSVANNTLKLITWTIYPAATSPVMPYSFLYTNGAWRAIYTVQPAQYATLGLGKYNQFTSANNIPQTLGALVNADVTVTDTIKTGDIVYVSYNYEVSSTVAYQRVQPLEYNGSKFVLPYNSTNILNFKKANGVWAYVQPLPIISHTLTTADLTLIANSTVATSALRTNVGSYGDFSSSWTPAYLDAAFIVVLQADYTTPVINTNYEVVYKAYVGGADVPTIASFQWINNAWVAQQ